MQVGRFCHGWLFALEELFFKGLEQKNSSAVPFIGRSRIVHFGWGFERIRRGVFATWEHAARATPKGRLWILSDHGRELQNSATDRQSGCEANQHDAWIIAGCVCVCVIWNFTRHLEDLRLNLFQALKIKWQWCTHKARGSCSPRDPDPGIWIGDGRKLNGSKWFV